MRGRHLEYLDGWRGLAIGVLLVGHFFPEAPALVRTALSLAPLRQLGIWSFSIYLWQQPFYLLVGKGKLPLWAGFPLALLAGIASFYVIESPARRYLNRVWGKQSPPNAEALAPQAAK
jgi:peptidoglycan/LPS O-acetylase OafA/YrhL